MARGRFISNSISTSKKFSRLSKNDHRLMYLMLVPHVDAEGRHDADARILSGQVYTLLGLTLQQIEDGLADMHQVGLITLYSVKDDRYLEITDFHEHNKVRRDKDGNPSREAASSIPAPSAGTVAGPAPDQLRSNSAPTPAQGEGLRVKSKVKVQVQEEHSSIAKSEAPPPKALAAPPPRESHDPGLFKEIWNTNRGRLPAVQALNNKRKGQIRALVKEHGPQPALELFRDATRAVAADDFWINRQYGFDNLLAGKVLQKAEQWRAGAVQLTQGNRQLANTALTVANAIGGLDDQPN